MLTDEVNSNNVISIHALLAESDSVFFIIFNACCAFLSTLSLRRATRTGLTCGGGKIISIHALLAESDEQWRRPLLLHTNFYPRSPCGERPIKGKPASPVIGISIHALLAESDHNRLPSIPSACISIHALLAESDILTEINKMATGQISIHALLAESDDRAVY